MAHLAHLWRGDTQLVIIDTEHETSEELQARYKSYFLNAWVELDDVINWQAWPCDRLLVVA